MKLFQASRNLAHVTAQFSAAGLNIEDFLAADETALAAHLETLRTPAVAVPTANDEKAIKELADLRAAHTALTSQLTAAGLDPANLAKSLTDRVALKAAELTATQGIPSAVPAAVASAPAASTAPAAPALKGLAKVEAAFRTQSAKSRAAAAQPA